MTTAVEGSPCPYCEAPVTFRSSSAFIYSGKDYGPVYACSRYPSCDAFVGCHPGTKTALGRLANPELRYWKKRAHAALDPLWQDRWRRRGGKKAVHRGAAYGFLREKMGLTAEECHVGMFDVASCQRVVELCAPYCRRIAAGEIVERFE